MLSPTPWPDNPAATIERVFADIAQNSMADFPLANSRLTVEAIAFQRYAPVGGAPAWLGILIAPWTMNLMLLPATGGDVPWPDIAPGAKCLWRFPSGSYEFIVAAADGLGVYHLCSLFSPPLDFADQAAARQTAFATLAALLHGANSEEPTAESPGGRRAFLGFLGKKA